MRRNGQPCINGQHAAALCTEPYAVAINQPSISGQPATIYCGIDENLTACEAVSALQRDWRCTGTDGMCGPVGMAEQAVPGALCRQVGLGLNRCTYACGGAINCFFGGGAASTCDDNGGMGPPNWCGG